MKLCNVFKYTIALPGLIVSTIIFLFARLLIHVVQLDPEHNIKEMLIDIWGPIK